MKYKKRKLLLPVIIIIVGLVFVITSFIVHIINTKMIGGIDSLVEAYNIEETSSVDKNGNSVYKYDYYYIVDDKKYICKSNTFTNDRIEDEKGAIVEYNSNNPSICLIPNNTSVLNIFVTLFIIMGSFLTLIGVLLFIIIKKRMKLERYF